MKQIDDQLSLNLFFDLHVPSPEAGSAGAAIEIAKTMSDAISQAPISREEIVERMSSYLGRRVSVWMLNRYTAPSDETHHISLERAIAFDLAVGAPALLHYHAARCGGRAYVGRDALLAELGRAEMLRDGLNCQIRQIKSKMAKGR